MIFGHLEASLRRLDELDDNMIIAFLIQHLALELDISMFPGANEYAHHFVGNDRVESEEFAKLDLGLAALRRCSMFLNN